MTSPAIPTTVDAVTAGGGPARIRVERHGYDEAQLIVDWHSPDGTLISLRLDRAAARGLAAALAGAVDAAEAPR